MLSFPNCKINIGLNIINRREDGFHNLETVFYPVGLSDVIEIIKTEGNGDTAVHFSQSGIIIEGNDSDNLCIRAYNLLKKDFPDLPAVQIHLHKTIPTGAGLGGGSADGTFTLQLLNTKFNLHISAEQLVQYALELGSDCPFFILNKPCFATGRGEILEETELNLSGYHLLIVNPGIHVNTGRAFSMLSLSENRNNQLKENIAMPVSSWKEHIFNDFEIPVFKEYPLLQKIKNELYSIGAEYASMSGSGSTLYGIYSKKPSPDNITSLNTYFTKLIAL